MKAETVRGIPTIRVSCPCGRDMIGGPRGGAAQNFYCTDRVFCRQGWNLTIRGGDILMHQPIGIIDDERYRMYDE